jgi:hypothetical protein
VRQSLRQNALISSVRRLRNGHASTASGGGWLSFDKQRLSWREKKGMLEVELTKKNSTFLILFFPTWRLSGYTIPFEGIQSWRTITGIQQTN